MVFYPGIALGERFERSAMTSAPRVILGSAITTILMMAVALVLAVIIADEKLDIVATAMIAATAPGGLAEMSLTAALLNLGVPLVTGLYHIIRIIMITLLTLHVPSHRAALPRSRE